jgi:hypothetical protein
MIRVLGEILSALRAIGPIGGGRLLTLPLPAPPPLRHRDELDCGAQLLNLRVRFVADAVSGGRQLNIA